MLLKTRVRRDVISRAVSIDWHYLLDTLLSNIQQESQLLLRKPIVLLTCSDHLCCTTYGVATDRCLELLLLLLLLLLLRKNMFKVTYR